MATWHFRELCGVRLKKRAVSKQQKPGRSLLPPKHVAVQARFGCWACLPTAGTAGARWQQLVACCCNFLRQHIRRSLSCLSTAGIADSLDLQTTYAAYPFVTRVTTAPMTCLISPL